MANVAYIFRSSYVTMIKRLMIMILTDIDDSQLGKLSPMTNSISIACIIGVFHKTFRNRLLSHMLISALMVISSTRYQQCNTHNKCFSRFSLSLEMNSCLILYTFFTRINRTYRTKRLHSYTK